MSLKPSRLTFTAQLLPLVVIISLNRRPEVQQAIDQNNCLPRWGG